MPPLSSSAQEITARALGAIDAAICARNSMSLLRRMQSDPVRVGLASGRYSPNNNYYINNSKNDEN
eukprot:2786732-Amphidinium_carterae.1